MTACQIVSLHIPLRKPWIFQFYYIFSEVQGVAVSSIVKHNWVLIIYEYTWGCLWICMCEHLHSVIHVSVIPNSCTYAAAYYSIAQYLTFHEESGGVHYSLQGRCLQGQNLWCYTSWLLDILCKLFTLNMVGCQTVFISRLTHKDTAEVLVDNLPMKQVTVIVGLLEQSRSKLCVGFYKVNLVTSNNW